MRWAQDVKNKLAIKIIAYAALLTGTIVFGVLFAREFSRPRNPDITETPLVQPDTGEPVKAPKLPAEQPNHFMVYLALFLACGIPLGLLAAKDLSEFLGQEAIEYIFNDEGEGQRNPDFEAAEMEVTGGNVLEAVRMMRAYYERRPREVYVALRIAELYESNLNNPLAAALEYEDVLRKKLPPERWGWAAIHLANLYSGKLDKPEQAMALLNRIVREYAQTAAAKKARERLGLPEDAPAPATVAKGAALPAGFRAKAVEEQADHAAPASEGVAPTTPPAAEPSAAEPAAPALPSGFRPRSDGGRAEHHAPASESVAPLEKPADAADEAAAPKLPPGFRPKEG